MRSRSASSVALLKIPPGRMSVVTDARREEAVRLHVGFEVLGRFQGERRIVDDRFLADLAFEAVPPVVLVGVGLIVDPNIEIRSQEALVGALPHVTVEFRSRDTLLFGDVPVVLDRDLLYQIAPFGQFAHDAARRAGGARYPPPAGAAATAMGYRRRIGGYWLKNPCSRSSSK